MRSGRCGKIRPAESELSKNVEFFFDSMTDEEFQESLKKAGFDFHKRVKTPVFSKIDSWGVKTIIGSR